MGARRVFNPSVRVLGYFLLVFVSCSILRQVPFFGAPFRIPLLGFFLTAILLSTVGARLGLWLQRKRTLARELRTLGVVDTPRTRGKLGRLLLANGRAREAIGPLQAALESDGDNLDWRYRLGLAHLQCGEAQRALELLVEVAQRDERFAYGELWIHLARAHGVLGDGEAALQALERFERVQGPTPEQTYLLGCALKSMGRGADAREAFDRLSSLVEQAPKYQRASARRFLFKSYFARLGS